MTSRLLLLPVLAVAACSNQDVNLGGNYEVAAFVPPIENHAIDLLFVVDSSGSMINNQAAVAAKSREALFDVIDAAIGGMPDLHVGVITPDLDLGITTGDGQCDDSGDGGALLIGACTGITGAYLSDVDDGAGGRITNYTGTLDEAFGCIVQVGGNGCGFEQPLLAIQTALTNPANAGFLRDDALLVVVMLTDEDDCSAADPALFDPNDPALGPLDSYRCFHESTQCVEDLDSVGVKTECVARDDNPLVTSLDAIEQALVTAKGGDPSKVMVAAIAGPPAPVEVGMYDPPSGDGPRLTLVPSCLGEAEPGFPFPLHSDAFPAIRLDEFLGHFPGRSWFDSICAPADGSLHRTADAIGDLAGKRACLRGDLKDVDEDAAGIQPSCRAFLATAAFTPSEVRRELDECDGHEGNCFEIVAGSPACSHWDGGFEVELVGVTQGATEHLIVECIAP